MTKKNKHHSKTIRRLWLAVMFFTVLALAVFTFGGDMTRVYDEQTMDHQELEQKVSDLQKIMQRKKFQKAMKLKARTIKLKEQKQSATVEYDALMKNIETQLEKVRQKKVSLLSPESN